MELVKGVNFVEHVRGSARTSLATDRLTSAFRQLVDGVAALHALGKLHRDIKPSNVLVTHEGRVVVLDFGLITELSDTLGGDHIVGGTPAYLAPEEAAGAYPSQAGDWYSVGATLYEALTGEPPFRGPLIEVLLRKKDCDPPPPVELSPSVPAEFDAICMAMMRRDPAQRMSGLEAVERLAGRDATTSAPARVESPGDAPFVGRAHELDVLESALLTVTHGHPAAVWVSGPSGIGKSALVRSFLGRVTSRDDDVVVLSGRCYEHESVPYKALDGVVDSLSRYMVSLPDLVAERTLPADVVALPRLFPIMLRVPAIARACREREPLIGEPSRLRHRGFEVLRELLARIAGRRRVVISIDDLHWADLDGTLLLEELLRPPDAPALLTVVSFRSEEVSGNPFLRALMRGGDRSPWVPLPLRPMTDTEAGALLRALLRADCPTGEDEVRITREAGGSPFVLEQLGRSVGVDAAGRKRWPTFAGMLETRLAALSAEARRFVETLAICARPMAPQVICDGLRHRRRATVPAGHAPLHALCPRHRVAGLVEAFHDRMRDVVAAQMVPGTEQRLHALMARTLVARGSDDCEALFEHYRGAGDVENASIQASRSAAKASAALAFDRAASFYRHALALTPASPSGSAWKEGLAEALANAGRPAEAGRAYVQAAAGAGHRHDVELRRRGAEQFLIAGDIDQGLELLQDALAKVGLRVPRSARGALLSLLWGRARLAWRGLRFVPRDTRDIDPDTLFRVDTCWSATTGLLLVDMLGAGAFSARHLRMALDAGDPFRVARGMAIESAARNAIPTSRTRSRTLAERSKELALAVGHPHAVALSILAGGMMAVAAGEWRKTLDPLRGRAGDPAKPVCRGHLGIEHGAEPRDLGAHVSRRDRRRVPEGPRCCSQRPAAPETPISKRNCARGATTSGWRPTIRTKASASRWRASGAGRSRGITVSTTVRCWRACRPPCIAVTPRRPGACFPSSNSILRHTYLTRVQVLRVESFYLRGRSALAMAAAARDTRRYLAVARDAAQRIARERRAWSDPIGRLVHAGIAHLERDPARAAGCLHEAIRGFDRADMRLYAAAARHRLGALQDDQDGGEARRQAEAWMAAQQIRNQAAMTRMLAPGFPDRP